MFLGEKVRFCKDCRQYGPKDWSVFNYECKLGEKTPSGGHTGACNRFKHVGGFYCKDCARWDDGFGQRCIKGHPSPNGRSSEQCDRFAKG